MALVIGNAAYRDAPLKNPVNDARAITALLQEFGFAVTELENANQQRMEEAIRSFRTQLASGRGVGLFFFAGHGVSIGGKNYLLPVDQVFESESDVQYKATDAGFVMGAMEDAGARVSVLILDACRNNPFGARSLFRSAARGLTVMEAPKGSLVAFATAPGSTAADGSGENGLYTQELIKTVREMPGIEVEQLMKKVSSRVQAASGNSQVPYRSSSLTGEFYFKAGTPISAPQPPPTATTQNLQFAGRSWEPLSGEWFIQGDKLVGIAGPKDRVAAHLFLAAPRMRNYTMECDVECLSPSGWFGTSVRASVVEGGAKYFRGATSDNQGYACNFSTDNRFQVFRGVGGSWFLVNPAWKDWQPSSALTGSKVHLRWVCQEDEFSIYSGEGLLHRFTDKQHPFGSVILVVGHGSSYRISNFKLAELGTP